MTLLPALRRAYWHLLFRFSRRHVLEGIDVRTFLPDEAEAETISAKTADAFALLREWEGRHLARVRSLTDGVLLFGTVGALGSWNKHARLIRVSQDFIAEPGTQPIHVAATIVHEATHAWLDSLGFSYAPHQRPRVEAICHRAEAAFVRRVPGSGNLASVYESCAQYALDAPKEWSDQAYHDRAYSDLKELGFPDWLAKRVSRSSSVLPNERCSDQRVY